MMVVGLDPGKSTGIVICSYSETEPLSVLEKIVTHNGIDGFSDWWHSCGDSLSEAEWAVESFVLRGSNDFVADLSGVEIIGFLKGMKLPHLSLQARTLKPLVPDALLKKHGLWVTGKEVNHTDGRDVLDAEIHALVYMMKKKHGPTLRKYFEESINV